MITVTSVLPNFTEMLYYIQWDYFYSNLHLQKRQVLSFDKPIVNCKGGGMMTDMKTSCWVWVSLAVRVHIYQVSTAMYSQACY